MEQKREGVESESWITTDKTLVDFVKWTFRFILE